MNILQKLNSSFGLLATILGAVGITIFQFVKEIDVYVKETSLYNNLIKTDNLAGWCVMLVIMITIMVGHFVYLNILYRKKIKIFEKGVLDKESLFAEKLVVLKKEYDLEINSIRENHEMEIRNRLNPLNNKILALVKSIEDDLKQIYAGYKEAKVDNENDAPLQMAIRNVESWDIEHETMNDLFYKRWELYDEEKVCMVNVFQDNLPALENLKDANMVTLNDELIDLIVGYIEKILSFKKVKGMPDWEHGVIYHLTNHNDERVDIVNKIKNKIKQ